MYKKFKINQQQNNQPNQQIMRKTLFLFSTAMLGALCLAGQPKKPESDVDKKVDALIAQMTLEEKVGQMTEVTSDVVSKSNTDPHQLDPDKLKEAIMKYHVG